jgi:hypothetical protein
MVKKKPSTSFVTSHISAQHWPRRTGLPAVFTAFVRGLQGAETPDADLFHDVWHGLRAALAAELKRRGLWQCSPSYLGISGWDRWISEEPQGALGELVADCYAFIFIDRLASLKRQLESKLEVEGLVLLNIRHFLHERQKAHDPLGFRIFEQLQAAVAGAVASGALHVLGGDPRIRNDTLLGFAPAADPPVAPADLGWIVRSWQDDLLRGLITAQSRQLPAVVNCLRQHILELPRLDVTAFRFRDLLEPLKSVARQRWAALLGHEEKGAGALPAPLPTEGVAFARQSFEHLTRCVSASIPVAVPDPRQRAQLAALWQYLRRRHGYTAENETGEGSVSYRQLSRRLNIPRERLPGLFATLRQLVTRYQTNRRARCLRREPPAISRQATGELV